MIMQALYDPAPEPDTSRILLVMLPGANGRPQDLVQWGFVQALRERNLPIDVVAVDAHLGYYLERSLSSHLTHDIIAPARARNYQRIWLMGISLGGMGSLLYARDHPADIEGVILLAPFLGARGTIAEVVRAGGLAHWQPGAIKPDDDERLLLAWIKACQPAVAALPTIGSSDFRVGDMRQKMSMGVSQKVPSPLVGKGQGEGDRSTIHPHPHPHPSPIEGERCFLPKVYLGYGTDDRFAAASQLLAERLPAAQVVTLPGGHDWATWICLWQHLLDQDMFSGDGKAARRRVPVPKQMSII